MSVDRQRDVQVDVELGENAAQVTVTETREVAELFDENGELRLWEAGRSGYRLDSDGNYYWVNSCHAADDWASEQLV